MNIKQMAIADAQHELDLGNRADEQDRFDAWRIVADWLGPIERDCADYRGVTGKQRGRYQRAFHAELKRWKPSGMFRWKR